MLETANPYLHNTKKMVGRQKEHQFFILLLTLSTGLYGALSLHPTILFIKMMTNQKEGKPYVKYRRYKVLPIPACPPPKSSPPHKPHFSVKKKKTKERLWGCMESRREFDCPMLKPQKWKANKHLYVKARLPQVFHYINEKWLT